MARYDNKPLLRGSARVPDRGDVVDRRVSFAVRRHENHAFSKIETRGWGEGLHRGTVRLDKGDRRFSVMFSVEWHGDDTELLLEFVPAGVIALIDGCEVRF